MLLKLKEELKSTVILYSIIKRIRRLQYYISDSVIFSICRGIRISECMKNNKYMRMKSFKDKHKGQRCFIVATGPSLTIDDLNKLTDEITFSMNSACMVFGETKWRPTYYGIQDFNVYERIGSVIENSGLKTVFVGDLIAKKFDIPEKFVIYAHNMLNHRYLHSNYWTKFSNDCYKEIFDGYTITYSLIQIAAYMGFQEIYLLGADTNYLKDKQHFREHGVVDPTMNYAGIRMIEAYKTAKQYADENNIKIYNATRGGMLEVFDRVNLDDLLKEKKVNYDESYQEGGH